MKKKGLFLGLFIFLAMITVGCSSNKILTLEDYLKDNSEARQSIESVGESSGLDIKIKDNDIIYIYELSGMAGINAENVYTKEVKDAFESALNSTAGTFEGLCKTMEQETKINGIHIIVKYTFNGNIVIEKTFSNN